MEHCSICGCECIPDGIGTGYGIDSKGNKICYECCGKQDEHNLLNLPKREKYLLYLNGNYVTNWPGTLKIRVNPRIGRHNKARIRRDVWFSIQGKNFHGVQYGDDSEICYIQTVK